MAVTARMGRKETLRHEVSKLWYIIFLRVNIGPKVG